MRFFDFKDFLPDPFHLVKTPLILTHHLPLKKSLELP